MKSFTKIQISSKKINNPNKNDLIEKVEESSETEIKDPVSLFFSKLFESREMAHVYHLQVSGDEGSYAAHVALNSYYDDVIEFIDTMVEIYQGQYDIVDNYQIIDTNISKSKDRIDYFKDLVKFINDNRYVSISKDDTHLQNMIDEIVSLIYRLLYKLRFNK